MAGPDRLRYLVTPRNPRISPPIAGAPSEVRPPIFRLVQSVRQIYGMDLEQWAVGDGAGTALDFERALRSLIGLDSVGHTWIYFEYFDSFGWIDRLL